MEQPVTPAPGAPDQTVSDTLTREATHGEATTRARQHAFLEAIVNHGTITQAALRSGIARSTHYEWLDKDEDYKKAFGEAEIMFADLVREEVRRRAMEGWQEPVVYQGRIQTQPVFDAQGQPTDKVEYVTVTKFSERLLELLAKAKCSEFREKHEITGAGGGPVRIMAVRYPEKASDAESWAAQHKPKTLSE